MTNPMYNASIPVFRQMLGSLQDILGKTEAHATARKIEPDALLQARLFPDMFPLARQVQIACDFARSVPARLAGAEVSEYEASGQGFAELQARIQAEQAAIDNEATKLQMVAMLQQAEQRLIAGQRQDTNLRLLSSTNTAMPEIK